jgi:hypothetical protein
MQGIRSLDVAPGRPKQKQKKPRDTAQVKGTTLVKLYIPGRTGRGDGRRINRNPIPYKLK